MNLVQDTHCQPLFSLLQSFWSLEKVPQDLFHSVYFEYEENSTHHRLLSLNYAFCHIKRLIKTSEPVYTDYTVKRNQLNLSIFDTPRQITVKSSKQSRSW